MKPFDRQRRAELCSRDLLKALFSGKPEGVRAALVEALTNVAGDGLEACYAEDLSIAMTSDLARVKLGVSTAIVDEIIVPLQCGLRPNLDVPGDSHD